MAPPLTEKSSNSSLKSQEKVRFKNTTVENDQIHYGLPANFGEVTKDIYRSSFPHPVNFPALKKLGIKCIITLVDEPYTPAHAKFLKENGISHHRILVEANKDNKVKTGDHVVVRILEILLNRGNHPVLIHCNKGKHRTGCMVACFRKVQGWQINDVIAEYLHYSRPKNRPLDEEFIKAFDASQLAHIAQITGASSWQVSRNPTIHLDQEDYDQSPSRRHGYSSLSEVSIPDVI